MPCGGFGSVPSLGPGKPVPAEFGNPVLVPPQDGCRAPGKNIIITLFGVSILHKGPACLGFGPRTVWVRGTYEVGHRPPDTDPACCQSTNTVYGSATPRNAILQILFFVHVFTRLTSPKPKPVGHYGPKPSLCIILRQGGPGWVH